MKFLLVLLFSVSASATEVATVDLIQNKTTSAVLLSFSDASLYQALDKTWSAHQCKTWFTMSSPTRETYAPKACRAEVIKFLLENGYKSLGSDKTFTK